MSADRYEIIDQGCRVKIICPDGSVECFDPSTVGVPNLDDVAAGAIRQQARDLDQLRTNLAAAIAITATRDETIAELELCLRISRQSNKELRESAEQAEARLAELEKATAEPVAYQYAHPYFGGGKIWREEQRWNGHTSDEARALYAAPPAPVAEIREPTRIDDAMVKRVLARFFDALPIDSSDEAYTWLTAWRAELGPALGMVEIREPMPEECDEIARTYHGNGHVQRISNGRRMFNSVRAVLWPKEGM